MEIYLLNNIPESHWDAIIAALAGLLGVLIGALLSYYSDKKLKDSEKVENAIIDATSIRCWLLERLGDTVSSKKRIVDMQEIIKTYQATEILQQHTEGNSENFNILTKEFYPLKHFYELNAESFKGLSLLRKKICKLEAIQQNLQFSANHYTEIESIKGKFNHHLQTIFLKPLAQIRPDLTPEIIFKNYLNSMSVVITGWIDAFDKIENLLRESLESFQILVCAPLNIDFIIATTETDIVEKLSADLLKYAREKELSNKNK